MPVKGPGITHICYQSPDDKPLYFKALEQGAEKLSKGDKPIDRGFGVKYAYSRDFDGNIFEMEQLRKPNFENEVWMGHVAIATPNIDSLVQFYTQLFGEDPVSRRNNIHNDAGLDSIGNINGLVLNGAWFRIGNMGLEIWQFVNPVTPQANGLIPYTETGYNKITFEIRNFESEMENIKKRGLFPSIDFKAKRALIRDSDGNLLELSGL